MDWTDLLGGLRSTGDTSIPIAFARRVVLLLFGAVLAVCGSSPAGEERIMDWRRYSVPERHKVKTRRPPDEEFLKLVPPLREAPRFREEDEKLGAAIWWADYSQFVFSEQPPTRDDLGRKPHIRTPAGEDEPLVLGLWGIEDAGKVTVEMFRSPFPVTVRMVVFAPKQIPEPYFGVTIEGGRTVGYATYLPEDATADVRAGENTVFWITVSVPDDAKPGTYRIPLRVIFHAYRKGVDLPVTVEVLPFKLPRAKIAFGMYFRPFEQYLEKRYLTEPLMRAYWRDMARHGMTSATLYNYASMTDNAGNFRLDGGHAIEWLKDMMEEGLVSTDVPIMYLGGITRTPENTQEILEEFVQEAKKRGWPKFYYYGPDEQSVNEKSLAAFKAIQPIRKYMPIVTAITDYSATAYADLLDIWVINAGRTTPEIRELAAKKDAQIWNYSCGMRGRGNAPFNRFYAGIYTWALGLTGNFLWCYTEGSSWGTKIGTHNWVVTADEGPIPSVAWETRREGVEDYRLLSYLESLVAADPDGSEAKEARAWLQEIRGKVDWYLARDMPPSLYPWDGPELYPLCPNFEPSELSEVRAKAIDYIMHLRKDGQE